jgi:hypothetical protein
MRMTTNAATQRAENTKRKNLRCPVDGMCTDRRLQGGTGTAGKGLGWGDEDIQKHKYGSVVVCAANNRR